MLLDENGNEIDLDLVDAIGELPDGRFQVWLQDELRVITSEPNAIEIWRQHFRSKSSNVLRSSEFCRSATS
jgi:hypothetical protein